MSSDPLNIADADAPPLELVWYGGPVRPEGTSRMRLAITRQGGHGHGSVDLSVTELARLAASAGVLRFVAAPFGVPLDGNKRPMAFDGEDLGNPSAWGG
jgi:hypothetical protein